MVVNPQLNAQRPRVNKDSLPQTETDRLLHTHSGTCRGTRPRQDGEEADAWSKV